MNSSSTASVVTSIPDRSYVTTIERPMDADILQARDRYSTIVMMGFGIAAVVVVFAFFYGMSGDNWFIFRLIGGAFYAALSLIPGGIIVGLGYIAANVSTNGVDHKIRTVFCDIVQELGGETSLKYEAIPKIDDARLYALDSQKRVIYFLHANAHLKAWQVQRLPLSSVRRYELLTATNSTMRGRESGGDITFTTESSSEYGIRFHHLDRHGAPGISLMRFGQDESLAQKWLTAIGG